MADIVAGGVCGNSSLDGDDYAQETISALKSGFIVRTDLDEQTIRADLRYRSSLDVVLDFDSNCSTIDEELASFDDICDSPIPIRGGNDRRPTPIDSHRISQARRV